MQGFNVEKHLRLARQLSAQGWIFRRENEDDRQTVDHLISDALSPSTLGPEQEGVVAVASDGRIGGAIRYQAVRFPKGNRIYLHAVVVAPRYRRQGVATVLLNVFSMQLRPLYGNPPVIGNCEWRMRHLYEDCGYRVLEPGQPLMDPVQGKLYCSDRRFDCWLVAG